ncbi:hypothetical protein KBC79_03895, partial [Candidatus Woesebacteria bacterium]|nr:hypothetical protein [Candidatus Woesebacteria bacterium]
MSEKLSNILEQFRHAVVLPNADLKEFAAKATESRVHIARHTFQVTEEDFGKRLMLFPMYVDANLILQPNKNRYLLSLTSKFVIHADACFDKDNIMRDLNISKVRQLVTDDFAEEEQLPGFEWWYEMYATSVALIANIASQPNYLIRILFPFRTHQSQAEFDKRMEHQQDQQELYELAIDPEEYETDEFTSLVESNSDEYSRIPWNDPHYFVQGGSSLQLASTSTVPV